MITEESLVKYRRFLKRRNYSAHTIKTYMNTLEHFRRWLPLPWEEVTYQEISAYIDFLLAQGLMSPPLNSWTSSASMTSRPIATQPGV